MRARLLVSSAVVFAVLAGGSIVVAHGGTDAGAPVRDGSVTVAPSGDDVAVAAGEGLVSTVPSRPFPRNRQSETSVAVDPSHPSVVAAGMNDVSDLRCTAYDADGCHPVQGVGVSGVSFSLDGGVSWHQPSYPDGSHGPIHTLPGYRERGLVARGDPTLAFGPRPDGEGAFSWANGSRLYYANITTAPGHEDHAPYEGRSAIAVSRTDRIERAAAGRAGAWRAPAIVSSGSGLDAFNDKPWIAVDDAATSPSFGAVYACWTVFGGPGPAPAIVFSRSGDGGSTWSSAIRLSTADDGGRQGCQIATDSRGTVFVTWSDTPPNDVHATIHVIARSRDGGRHFDDPVRIAQVDVVGKRDPLSNGRTFDGVAGSRTSSFPSISIANGAPSGEDATDAIAVAWADGRGGSDERALVKLSADGGRTWSSPVDASAHGERPDMVAVALAPNGSTAYVVYDAFAVPWRAGVDVARPVAGVVRSAPISADGFGTWTTIHRGASGDARGATTSTLVHGTLYDYNDAVATDDGVVAVWADARRVRACAAVDRYRERRLTRERGAGTTNATTADAGEAAGGGALLEPASPGPPSPRAECPNGFGDVDIYGGRLTSAP